MTTNIRNLGTPERANVQEAELCGLLGFPTRVDISTVGLMSLSSGSHSESNLFTPPNRHTAPYSPRGSGWYPIGQSGGTLT